ncbi:MAG: universal stress protein [Solirubrobacteraceae bacterium]
MSQEALHGAVTLHAIVSYDDTSGDLDALALGALLHATGARLTLAYVRHATQGHCEHERLSQEAAEALLERGAARLGDERVQRRVVVSASTGEGLGWLAEQERADLIAFGSEYRTPRGHVAAGRTAQVLLEGGPVAIALAPSGYAAQPRAIGSVALLPGCDDPAGLETAAAIAARFDASVVGRPGDADLLVAGSRAQAPPGRVSVSALTANAIEQARAPVLIVARGVAVGAARHVAA